MAIYNQEHRDYGAHRKYPFTDASTLSVSGGSALPAGLLVDAVLYLSTSPDDAEVWLDTLDLGDRRVSIRTSKGVTASGVIDGGEVALQDDTTGLAAGVLLLGADALVEAKRTRYVMTPRAALFSPSCVFMSTTPGVATINQAAGHLTLEGRDGIQVFTGIVDGRPVLRVDAVGEPKTYEGCETGTAVRGIRFIQQAGALISATTAVPGSVILDGVSTFTGEALCVNRNSGDTLRNRTGSWYLAPEYSPEAWRDNPAVQAEMADLGFFWVLSDPNSFIADGLIVSYRYGSPMLTPTGSGCVARGNYTAYGYGASGWGWLPCVYVRPFQVRVDSTWYDTLAWRLSQAGGYQWVPSMFREPLPYTGLAGTHFTISGGTGDPASAVLPADRVVVDVPDQADWRPYAALVPIHSETPWQPAEAQEALVFAERGSIAIYTPSHEDSSNPLKSDRTAATLRLRGRG